MYRSHSRTFIKTAALLLLFVVMMSFVYAGAQGPPPRQLLEGWEYRLGDSPKGPEGLPMWAAEDDGNLNWKPFNIPGQPPNMHGFKDTWLRVTLPTIHWEDTSIFFKTNDQLFEVYLDSKKIYQFGNIENPDDRRAPGSPWHMITLPHEYEGKTLYIRMHTMFPRNAGLVRVAEMGAKGDLLSDIVKDSMLNVIMSLLFVFMGVCLILVFLFRKSLQGAFPALGFSSICVGLWLLSETDVKQLFLDAPRIWLYIAFTTLFLMPVGFCYFVEQIFGKSKRNRTPIRLVWETNIAYAVLAFLLDITGLLPIILTLNAFYIVMAASVVAIIVTISKSDIRNNFEGKVFLAGSSVLFLSGIYDVLGWSFRLVPWTHYITPFGMFIFIFSLVYILSHRVVQIHEQLVLYSNEIESKNQSLKHMYREVEDSRNKLAEWNKSLEQMVAARTAAVRNLLNNAGQGFLSFGEDLTVNEEYSYECTKIFGGDISRKGFPDLVFPDDKEQRKFLESILTKMLSEKDEAEREKYFYLLPGEVQLGNQYVHMTYKIISDAQNDPSEIFMVILTDITDKRSLENQMKHEKNKLKMVIKIVSNYGEFTESIKDYESFCLRKLPSILSSKRSAEDMLYEIYRAVHTFKETFSRLEAANLVEKLHHLETETKRFKKTLGNADVEDVRRFISKFHMESWLEENMTMLKDILGEQLFSKESALMVDRERLMEIEKKLLHILPPGECKLILPDIQRLRYRPFKEILKNYPDYVTKIAEKAGKYIHALEIKGGDILVDIDKYHEFAKVLMHVFQNAIDHGIESPEERYAIGKEEGGNIRCTMKQDEGRLLLTIADDGRGIDLQKVRIKAVEKGIYDESTASNLPDSEIINVIFEDRFSTNENTSQLSGRGVGLADVKSEILKLDGTVCVKSEKGVGTELQFVFPYEEEADLPKITVEEIMSPVMEITKNFLAAQTNMAIKHFRAHQLQKTDNLVLKEFTCFIGIKGILNGKFALTMDESLARRLVRGFVIDDISEDEEKSYIEDVMAECANIIVGNSIKVFDTPEDFIMMDPPLSIHLKDTVIKLKTGAWVSHIESESGKMWLSFIASEEELNPEIMEVTH